MLSSHGAFDTNFESKLPDYTDLCNDVADEILDKVTDKTTLGATAEVTSEVTAYIGFDGDLYNYNAPICYLFLKVLDHLIKKNIKVQPIVCQFGDYIKDAIPENNQAAIGNLLETYETSNASVASIVRKFEPKNIPINIYNFKEFKTIQLSYTEVGKDKKESIQPNGEKNYKIEINYGLSYTPMKESDLEKNPDQIIDISPESLTNLIKNSTIEDTVYKMKKPTFRDGRSDCYGGYTEGKQIEGSTAEGTKKLVGSTAGWKLYLEAGKAGIAPQFSEVYYYPVWLNDVKPYADSITDQIGKAVEEDLFGIHVTPVTKFVKQTTSVRGGSRKLTRFIKKKSKRRRTKSKKPLSKSRRLKKGKKRSRRRN